MSSLIAWILRAIPFGTIIMYGALGETITEKSGNLNLGVPGIMYLGGFAGFASAYYYENTVAEPVAILSILLALVSALAASALGGLIYAFLTITLRANQNVTGLALTTFGMGVANFFGVFILDGATYSAAPLANKAFAAKIPVLSGLGAAGQLLFSYGFLVYAAILLAVALHWFFTRASGPPPSRSRPWAGWRWRWSSSPPGSPSTPSGAPTCSASSTGCTSSCPASWASRCPAP